MPEPTLMATTPAPAAVIPLASWSCCAQAPGTITHPDQLPSGSSNWLPATAPGTVAGALQLSGQWDFSRPRDLDAEDWWFRTTFAAPELVPGQPCRVQLDGLATLAEVWLNGQRVLTTDNMFRSYQEDVAPYLEACNELVIGFRSLTEELKRKRPRPRWKTNLVNHQQLRWVRTSLLGRMPGWSPMAPPVGPWRAVRLDLHPFSVEELRLTSRLVGRAGIVALLARLEGPAPIDEAMLQVGNHEEVLQIQQDAAGGVLCAEVRLPDPPLWWPHTHGDQPLVECILHLRVGSEQHALPCGRVGFRHLEAVREGGLALRINGVPVFCRGACWLTGDALTLSEATLAHDLNLAREVGANMLRVSGTAAYESDLFYQLCDELGILVWQDFMFANMDYPVEDSTFAANVEAEARGQLARLAVHPCLAVLCGNSEVEQQAAMRGAPREVWRNAWFGTRLPELCAEYSPETAYVPSTPSGGALPFHVREGVAHYYGVGAYLRSPQDLRQADVKFASECLAFANVPEPETVAAVFDPDAPALHHPRWKQRVPRDTGAGWDFEDVRDFYLRHLFGVDPVQLRSCDTARYLQLSRVASGEMMTRVFGEWRSGHSHCAGGLVWFFKDLWPGAGWGVVDSSGLPKAACYYLRRSWRPQQVTLTDEGLDGLHLHLTNEAAESLRGSVELLLLKDDHIVVARQEVPCLLPARTRQTLTADAILDGFYDVTYAYRFGPPAHDAIIATLFDEQRQVLSEAHHFAIAREPAFLPTVRLRAEAMLLGGDCYQVSLECDHLLRGVSVTARGFLPDDNYFHLPPARTKAVRFTALQKGARFRATLEALNLRNLVVVRLPETPS